MSNHELAQLREHQSTKPGVPVAFIIFRRPETTSRVFEEIRRAKPEKLYIIADGARPSIPGEQELVDLTRKTVEVVDWPCEVVRVYASSNLGLRERVLTGLDEVFSRESSAIILEDDCLPSQSFFRFASDLLEKYEADKRIAMISGFNFAPSRRVKDDYFFSYSTYIWGWSTWARTWQAFRNSPQVETWSAEDTHAIRSSFASRIQTREFLGLMSVADTLNTWDISLAVWVRQSKLFSVIPRINLIENIGFGAQATHTKFEAFDVQTPKSEFTNPLIHPDRVTYDKSIERRMWTAKSMRWLTFPIMHPVQFVKRFTEYLRIK
jgi:hypothetical protein